MTSDHPQTFLDAIRRHCGEPTAFQCQQLDSGRGRDLFVGNYVIVDRLGRGAMSVVYKAVERGSKRTLALKLLAPAYYDDPGRLALMRREGEVAMAIQHPNVVRTFAVRTDRKPFFLAMELLDGRSLDDILKERKYLRPDQALRITRLVGHALQAVDDRNCVHGDIKPGNIFICSGGRVKLTDFGLAHAFGQNEEMRRQGYVLGTGYYVAPEVASLRRTNDIRSDLYSLGVVLYQMLTGIVPFPARTRNAAMNRHQTSEMPNIRTQIRNLPEPVCQLVEQLMQKDPGQRVQTPSELLQMMAEAERSLNPLFKPNRR